ncbi:MAG: ChaN family lipoprotein [Planctomycetes bacterium]|nr:ChaN family lipoprotein [Planctomycetota bacterium]
MPVLSLPRGNPLSGTATALFAVAASAGVLLAAPPSEPPSRAGDRELARDAARAAAERLEKELDHLRKDIEQLVVREVDGASRELARRDPAVLAAAATLGGRSYEQLLDTVIQTRDLAIGEPADLYETLADTRIVYVAESHDNPAHHGNQLAVLEAMYEQQPDVAIGMEMFPRSCQLTLDRFVAGLLTEEQFLREVNWKETWGFDYKLYRPILEFARRHGLPLVALNAPRDLVRKVGRSGLAGLSQKERASLPEMDIDVPEHREHFRQAMARLAGSGHAASEFSYQAMCVWDETMADSVVRFFRAEERRTLRMVVLAGTGHIEYRVGIPDRVAKALRVKTRTVVSLEVAQGEHVEWPEVLGAPAADYLWITKPAPARGESKAKPGRR